MGNVGRTDPCQMAPLPLSEFTGVQHRYDSYLFQVTLHYPSAACTGRVFSLKVSLL